MAAAAVGATVTAVEATATVEAEARAVTEVARVVANRADAVEASEAAGVKVVAAASGAVSERRPRRRRCHLEHPP